MAFGYQRPYILKFWQAILYGDKSCFIRHIAFKLFLEHNALNLVAELQIRGVIEDNSKIIFLISQ